MTMWGTAYRGLLCREGGGHQSLASYKLHGRNQPALSVGSDQEPLAASQQYGAEGLTSCS